MSIFIALYLLFSFVKADFNYLSWGQDTRSLLVFLFASSLIIRFIIFLATVTSPFKTKELDWKDLLIIFL